MFKIMYVNAITQHLIREVIVDTKDLAEEQLHLFERASEIEDDVILFSSDKRTLRARYVSHSIVDEKGITVYKLFFKVKLANLQAKIKETSVEVIIENSIKQSVANYIRKRQ